MGRDANERETTSVHSQPSGASKQRNAHQSTNGDDGKRSTGLQSDGDKAGVSERVNADFVNHRGKTDLDTLYRVANSRSDVNNSFVEFGAIDKELAQRIKADTAFDVQGWQVALDETYLRHILKNHGNEKSENARGQSAIGLQDFSRIMEVVRGYDKASRNDDAIVFEKNIDGNYTLVTTLRTGRKKLAVTTLYKSKKSSTQVLVAPDQSQSTDETPETLLGRKIDDSLANPNNSVNTTKALDNAITSTNQADEQDGELGIGAFVAQSIGNPTLKDSLSLGNIPKTIAQKLSDNGYDVAQYLHTLTSGNVRHIVNRHGDEKVEKQRGQLPMTTAEIKKIPDVLANPDYLVLGGKTRRGLDTIIYTKTMNVVHRWWWRKCVMAKSNWR